MKRIIAVLVVAFALAASAFAADDASKITFNLGISFPQIYNLKPADKEIDSERYSAVGFNFAVRFVVGLPFGFYADGNVYVPYSQRIITGDVEYRYDLSDVKVVGFDGQLGIYSVLVNAGRFQLPFGAGIHLNYQGTTYKNVKIGEPDSQSIFSFGAGVWANAELQLTEKFALYGGLRLNYDFFQRLKTETKISERAIQVVAKSGLSSMLFITPVFGAVIRF